MGGAYKSQSELTSELRSAKEKVTIGTVYAHFKNTDMLYRVTDIGFTEHDGELCVIYRAQYGDKHIFIRPLTSWLELVDHHGTLLPRFTIVSNV